MSQEFWNSDSVWESYANFNEDAQKFLCKTNCSSAAEKKTLDLTPQIHFSTSIIDCFWMCLYTHKTGHVSYWPTCLQGKSEKNFLGIVTKIGITFSYRIRITNFLARWKYCYEGYVMTWYRVSFGFYTFSSSCDLQKGMVHASRFLLWWHMSFMDNVHIWY